MVVVVQLTAAFSTSLLSYLKMMMLAGADCRGLVFPEPNSFRLRQPSEGRDCSCDSQKTVLVWACNQPCCLLSFKDARGWDVSSSIRNQACHAQ